MGRGLGDVVLDDRPTDPDEVGLDQV